MPPADFGSIGITPSGEDCNPLNRRLPAECVVRQARKGRKEEEPKTDEVVVDLATATSLKPEKRLAWLTKACKMAAAGKAPLQDLFNIVTTRRFASGINPRVSGALRDCVSININLFSEKQQRYLQSDEWALNLFKVPDTREGAEPAAEEEAEEEVAEPAESQGDKVEKPLSISVKPNSVISKVKTREVKLDKPDGASGGWVSISREDEDRRDRHAQLQEERRKARAKGKEPKLNTFEDYEEKQNEQRQSAKAKQLEEDVDSSIAMLEMLTQQRQQPSSPKRSSRKSRSRSKSRKKKKSRSRSRKKKSRSKSGKKKSRGLSRSRSISVQRSRSRKKDKKQIKMDRVSFEEALRARMEARDRTDTTRIPVVALGHAQRDWK